MKKTLNIRCRFALVVIFLCVLAVPLRAERDVQVKPVPPKATLIAQENTTNDLAPDMIEHAALKKKFIAELQTEASEFKKTIEATQDPVMKKERELKFRETRKQKIAAFFEEEKRREEMKKNIDQLKKSTGTLSS